MVENQSGVDAAIAQNNTLQLPAGSKGLQMKQM
jgi:hypothetical protein